MILLAVNLARSPFANTRPIVRVAMLLWTVAVLLGAYNGLTYWNSFSGSEATKIELETNQKIIEEAHQSIEVAENMLASLQLREQNETVHFLNAQIAERTFPWSLLFDDLSQILPNGVRLVSLNPTPTSRTGTQRNKQIQVADSVHLGIHAIAKKDADLLVFVDSLFASEIFRNPSLSSEKKDQATGEITFHLTTEFLLDVAAEAQRAVATLENAEAAEGIIAEAQIDSEPQVPSEGDLSSLSPSVTASSKAESTVVSSQQSPTGSPETTSAEKTAEKRERSVKVQRPTRGSQERIQSSVSPRTRISPEVRPRNENREAADPLSSSPRSTGVQVPGVVLPRGAAAPVGGVTAPPGVPPAAETKPWMRNGGQSSPPSQRPVPLSPNASSSRRLR